MSQEQKARRERKKYFTAAELERMGLDPSVYGLKPTGKKKNKKARGKKG